MTGPADYRFCTQTVTVYRKTPDGILRYEIPNVFLRMQDECGFSSLGHRQERKFLLVQPGEKQLVFAGDRVYAGIGPVVTQEQWSSFLPEQVDGLAVAEFATAYFWEGRFCHTEAGRKQGEL